MLIYELDRRRLADMYDTTSIDVSRHPGKTFGIAVTKIIACGPFVLAPNRGAVPDRACDLSDPCLECAHPGAPA